MAEHPEHADAPERIEWLELFFDLVVVAAVAVLTEGLRADATWGGLGIFLVTYGAVWFAWVSVVMYTDVAAELARVRSTSGGRSTRGRSRADARTAARNASSSNCTRSASIASTSTSGSGCS